MLAPVRPRAGRAHRAAARGRAVEGRGGRARRARQAGSGAATAPVSTTETGTGRKRPGAGRHVMPLGRWGRWAAGAAGPLGRWPLGRWAAGPLGRWAAGPLGRWAAGPLGRWAAGPLGRWAAGPLGRWAAGPLGRWAAGPWAAAAGPLGRWAIISSGNSGEVKRIVVSSSVSGSRGPVPPVHGPRYPSRRPPDHPGTGAVGSTLSGCRTRLQHRRMAFRGVRKSFLKLAIWGDSGVPSRDRGTGPDGPAFATASHGVRLRDRQREGVQLVRVIAGEVRRHVAGPVLVRPEDRPPVARRSTDELPHVVMDGAADQGVPQRPVLRGVRAWVADPCRRRRSRACRPIAPRSPLRNAAPGRPRGRQPAKGNAGARVIALSGMRSRAVPLPTTGGGPWLIGAEIRSLELRARRLPDALA